MLVPDWPCTGATCSTRSRVTLGSCCMSCPWPSLAWHGHPMQNASGTGLACCMQYVSQTCPMEAPYAVLVPDWLSMGTLCRMHASLARCKHLGQCVSWASSVWVLDAARNLDQPVLVLYAELIPDWPGAGTLCQACPGMGQCGYF